MNTPSVAQKFSFQTGKQVARGKLGYGEKSSYPRTVIPGDGKLEGMTSD